ncbi:ABC transporter substrate-binding protein [Cutibacterium sp. V947]|uniref:ABC transporter substrate-binding protein n=1 Tax=unclassified Cutibacterium TaxID=2649671 RepID=UPI003EE1864A
MRNNQVSRRTVIEGLAVAVLAAGCAPGSNSGSISSPKVEPSSVKTDAKAMGDVTLTVWDQEVRGGGNAQMTRLIADFEKKYPNIRIKRVSRSFDDLTKTLRLALSGNDAPDVVQANNTRSQLGQFVKARQLIPLDQYAKAYGWDKRYPESVRATASYSDDAKTFGAGKLYGLPQVGEVVGVYVNKAKLKKVGLELPKTWDDFESALGKAKGANEVPLMLGNLDKWPAIHVLGAVQGHFEDPEAVRKLGYGNKGATWQSDGNRKVMERIQEWVKKGYFNSGVNGLGYDPAWQQFSKGKGIFLIGGTWLGADLAKAMGGDVEFILPPPAKADGVSYTTGATGLPFAVTSKCKTPDAAAAFINHITSADAMEVIAETGNLPVVETTDQKASDDMTEDLLDAFGKASQDNSLLPYLDWATPTMSDTLGAALQSLLAGEASPEDTLKTLEKDYEDFVGNQNS